MTTTLKPTSKEMTERWWLFVEAVARGDVHLAVRHKVIFDYRCQAVAPDVQVNATGSTEAN